MIERSPLKNGRDEARLIALYGSPGIRRGISLDRDVTIFVWLWCGWEFQIQSGKRFLDRLAFFLLFDFEIVVLMARFLF